MIIYLVKINDSIYYHKEQNDKVTGIWQDAFKTENIEIAKRIAKIYCGKVVGYEVKEIDIE